MFVTCQRELCKWMLHQRLSMTKLGKSLNLIVLHTLISSKLAKTADFVILSKAKNLLWLIRKFSEKIIRHSLFECFFF